MELEIKKMDMVFTADDQELGYVISIFSNPNSDKVNPGLKLFERYLHVVNYTIGGDYYIPLDYVKERSEGKVSLNVTMKQVGNETLIHEPTFIAFGEAIQEELK